MKSKLAQGGFTLIELVVVITILGILAAFAVPRFVSLEGSARTAAVEALGGSVRSGAALAHALHLVNGGTSVTMEGSSVAITNGYPSTTAIGATLADAEVTEFDYDATNGVWTYKKAGTPANCSVTYAEPTATNAAPTITVVTGGCP
jgi:MSHA pilin protein MshA